MRTQNFTYALCMAAAANAVRLQTATKVSTDNRIDEIKDALHEVDGKLNTLCMWLGQGCTFSMEGMYGDIYGWNNLNLAQVQTSTELEA